MCEEPKFWLYCALLKPEECDEKEFVVTGAVQAVDRDKALIAAYDDIRCESYSVEKIEVKNF